MIRIKESTGTYADMYGVAASLASILENRPEDYPRLHDTTNWYLIINNYLHSLGYNLVLIKDPHVSALRGYHLIIQADENGKLYCVVGRDGTMVYDPSANGSKYNKPLKDISYGTISRLFL
jgi:hypothetical protein